MQCDTCCQIGVLNFPKDGMAAPPSERAAGFVKKRAVQLDERLEQMTSGMQQSTLKRQLVAPSCGIFKTRTARLGDEALLHLGGAARGGRGGCHRCRHRIVRAARALQVLSVHLQQDVEIVSRQTHLMKYKQTLS